MKNNCQEWLSVTTNNCGYLDNINNAAQVEQNDNPNENCCKSNLKDYYKNSMKCSSYTCSPEYWRLFENNGQIPSMRIQKEINGTLHTATLNYNPNVINLMMLLPEKIFYKDDSDDSQIKNTTGWECIVGDPVNSSNCCERPENIDGKCYGWFKENNCKEYKSYSGQRGTGDGKSCCKSGLRDYYINAVKCSNFTDELQCNRGYKAKGNIDNLLCGEIQTQEGVEAIYPSYSNYEDYRFKDNSTGEYIEDLSDYQCAEDSGIYGNNSACCELEDLDDSGGSGGH